MRRPLAGTGVHCPASYAAVCVINIGATAVPCGDSVTGPVTWPSVVAGWVSVSPASPTAVTVGKPCKVHDGELMLVNRSELSDFLMPLPPWSTLVTSSWLVRQAPPASSGV